jgi:hypothetical protein
MMKWIAYPGSPIISHRTGRRHMLRKMLQPAGRRESVCDDEGAQVQELAGHYRRLLGRDNDPHILVALLPNDAEKRLR